VKTKFGARKLKSAIRWRNHDRRSNHVSTVHECDGQTYGQTDRFTTRGRVRAKPSFQLGTLSTLIANLLCMTLVAAAAENQHVGKTRRRSIYSADRHATDKKPQ